MPENDRANRSLRPAPTAPGCTGRTSLIWNTLSSRPALLPCRDATIAGRSSSPRPFESELRRFFPSNHHVNENHSGVARLLVQFRARSRARFYGRLIRVHPGASSTSAPATAGTSMNCADSSTWNVQEIEVQPRRGGQGPGSGLRRPRGNPGDGRPRRSRREI